MSPHRLVPLLALVLLLFAPPAPAAGTVRGRLSFESEALGGPLHYSLYLPPGYDEDAARRYPVVYLLHGLGGRDSDWVRMGRIRATADRLIESGAIPPLIVVMPDGGNGWYVDSAAVGGPGDYGTAIGRDLIAHVDLTYRTVAGRRGRAIAGLSMGGFGALRLAFAQPERFAAAASLSGAVFRPVRSAEEAPAEGRIFHGAFGTPFDPARFNRASLFDRIDDVAALADPPGLYLAVGDDDGFGLWRSTVELFLALRDAGVPAELRVTDGDHVWPLWADQIEGALHFLAGHLAAPSDEG